MRFISFCLFLCLAHSLAAQNSEWKIVGEITAKGDTIAADSLADLTKGKFIHKRTTELGEETLIGSYRKKFPRGIWTLILSDKSFGKGRYRYNVRSYDYGGPRIYEYSLGSKQGTWTYYSPNGEYLRKEAVRTSFNFWGFPAVNAHYNDEKTLIYKSSWRYRRICVKTYFNNGQLKSKYLEKGAFYDSFDSLVYNSSGALILRIRSNEKSSKRYRIIEHYFPNGELKKREKYYLAKCTIKSENANIISWEFYKNGEWLEYNEAGELISSVTYEGVRPDYVMEEDF